MVRAAACGCCRRPRAEPGLQGPVKTAALHPGRRAGRPGPGPFESSYSGGGHGNSPQYGPPRALQRRVAATGGRIAGKALAPGRRWTGVHPKQRTPLVPSISAANSQQPVTAVTAGKGARGRKVTPEHRHKGRASHAGGAGAEEDIWAAQLSPHPAGGREETWTPAVHRRREQNPHPSHRTPTAQQERMHGHVHGRADLTPAADRPAHCGPETKCHPRVISVQAVSKE